MAQLAVTLEEIQHRSQRKHKYDTAISTTIGIGESYTITPSGTGATLLDTLSHTEYTVSESVSALSALLAADIDVNITNSTEDYFKRVSAGEIAGQSYVHKFGKNEDVAATFEPLSIGAFYQTPQPASATVLRVKAGNIADIDTTGTGARKITIQGLDETGALVSETLSTNGTSAGTAGTVTFMRVFRGYVSESGTYAGDGSDSMAATVIIETSAGVVWLTLHKPDVGRGQSQIGLYTIPLGYTAYVYSYLLTTDSNKAVDFLFFKRESILDSAAPYQARRTVVEEVGVQGHLNGTFLWGQKFTELTDLGWMVKAAAAAQATVDFDMLLIQNA